MFKKFNHILVPIDFSEMAEASADLAIATFGDIAEKITILTVSETMSQRHAMADVDKILHDAATTQLDKFKEKYSEKSKNIDYVVKKGNPAAQIIAAAEDMGVDLIVMGSQGRNSLASVFFGGTTYQVARKAPCSVFVVRN